MAGYGRGQSPYQGRYTVPIHDYSGIERGGGAWGEAFKGVGESIGQGIKDWKLKKDENKMLKGKLDALIKRATGLEGEILSGAFSDDDETNKRLAKTVEDMAVDITVDPDKSIRQQIVELETGLEGARFSINAMLRKPSTSRRDPGEAYLGGLPPLPDVGAPPPGVEALMPRPPSPMPADLTPEVDFISRVGMGGPAAGAALGATEEQEEDLASIFAGGPAAAYAAGLAEPAPSYTPPEEEPIPDAEMIQIERDPKYVPKFNKTQSDAKRNLARLTGEFARNPRVGTPVFLKTMEALKDLAVRPTSLEDVQSEQNSFRKENPGKDVTFTQKYDPKFGWTWGASITGDPDVRRAIGETDQGDYEPIPGLWKNKVDDEFYQYDPVSGKLESLGTEGSTAINNRRLALEAAMPQMEIENVMRDAEGADVTLNDFMTIANSKAKVWKDGNWYLEYTWYDNNNVPHPEEIEISPYARDDDGEVIKKNGKPVESKNFKAAKERWERYKELNDQLKGLADRFSKGPTRIPFRSPQVPQAPLSPPPSRKIDLDRARNLIRSGR